MKARKVHKGSQGDRRKCARGEWSGQQRWVCEGLRKEKDACGRGGGRRGDWRRANEMSAATRVHNMVACGRRDELERAANGGIEETVTSQLVHVCAMRQQRDELHGRSAGAAPSTSSVASSRSTRST